MREKRVFMLVDMEELEADVQVQAVALASRWVYFHPPRIVFEPKKRASPFLPDNSNILAKTPTRRP